MRNLKIFINKKENNNSNKQVHLKLEWPDHVIELNKKNFEEFIKKYPFSVVDFWAPWCAPCKAMKPRLRRLSNIFKGQVAFAKLNTQEYPDIAKKYKIMGIPYLIFFRYGTKISSITGLISVVDVKEILEKNLKKW